MTISSERKEIIIDLLGGWVSGGASTFCSQPIDTVLTRRQASVPGRGGGNAILEHTSTPRSLVRTYGISSLWRGSSAMIGAIPFQNSLMMAGYGIGKRFSEEHRPNHVLLGVFIGGCTGGVVQSFLMSPVELIKVNQQVHVIGRGFSTKMFANTVSWKGLNATLLRDGIPHGVWFASYEYCKNTLEEMEHIDGKGKHSSFVSLFSGAMAATLAWGVGYPFDIIKTRIQASAEPKSIAAVAKEIVRESNSSSSRHSAIASLYKGFSLKLAKAVPASAINFFVYESITKRLRD